MQRLYAEVACLLLVFCYWCLLLAALLLGLGRLRVCFCVSEVACLLLGCLLLGPVQNVLFDVTASKN